MSLPATPNPKPSWLRSWAVNSAARLLILLLCLLSVARPITGAALVATFIGAGILVLFGTLRHSHLFARFSACGAALGLVVLSQLLPVAQIDEGHNVLLFTQGDNSALQAALPGGTFDYAKTRFQQRYPSDSLCALQQPGCWRSYGEVPRAFAFSADSTGAQPRWSRSVTRIDFNDVRSGRFGFLNSAGRGDRSANWYPWVNRAADPVREQAPYFVRYRFDPLASGGTLCWRGTLLFLTAENALGFHARNAPSEQCQVLSKAVLPLEVVGLQFGAETPLAMRYQPPSEQVQALQLQQLASLLALLVLAGAWFRLPLATAAPLLLLSAAAALCYGGAALYDSHWAPLFAGGTDQLTHWGYGRWIFESAQHGNWQQALEGVEPTFYFMPGYRYFHALEMWLFGESDLLSYALLIMTPALCYRLALLVLPWPGALLAAASLLIDVSYASSLTHMSEAVAYPLALLALIAGLSTLGARQTAITHSGRLHRRLFAAAGLLALAVLLRPNLLPAAGLLLTFLAVLHGRWQSRLRPVMVLAAGFSPSGLLLLHNLYFGGEWVLLTRAADISVNLLAPPERYLQALAALLRGDTSAAAVQDIGVHLGAWLSGGGGSYLGLLTLLLLPLALLSLFNPRSRSTLVRLLHCIDQRLLGLMVFCAGQQGVLLFYNPAGRYGALAQLTAMIITIAVLWRLVQQLRKHRNHLSAPDPHARPQSAHRTAPSGL